MIRHDPPALFGSRDRNLNPSALDQYLAEVARYPRLTPEEELEAARAARAGDESAFQRLVTGNLYFAVYYVRRYQNRGLPMEDLVQEANVALVAAARAFDPERGTKLITLAVRMISQRVNAAITQQARVVTVPPRRYADMRLVSTARTRLAHQLGRFPTVDELAAATALRPDVVQTILGLGTSPRRLDWQGIGATETRLGLSAREEPLERMEGEARDQRIARAVASLREAEASVIRRHYGLGGDGAEPETLEQIAASRGVTPQRAHQLKKKALERLRPALGAALP